MPLIPVNCEHASLALAIPGGSLSDHLTKALCDLPPDAPIILLIHGYRFSARHARTDPHRHILSLSPRDGAHRAVSWPRHLGFGRGGEPDEHEGLCIAFGWEARGTLWQAHHEAERAGKGLVTLIGMIRSARPEARIGVLAHSLGARVLLSALTSLPAGSIGRAILMAAAEFQRPAQTALRSPAGAAAEIINITTRENDVFDLAMETLIGGGGRALGMGLGAEAANWLDVQVDQAETLTALALLGHRIAAPELRVCHWSAYLRPGIFGLYRALLRGEQGLTLDHLRAVLPGVPEPRWSRLLARPKLVLPLPRVGKASF